MFENPQLPVEIRAAGPCQCRVISRINFHAALQNYPEDLLHLQHEGSRMQKQDGDRWKRLGAVQRTKKKLKAIASMRAERASQKAAEADDEAVAPVRSSRALQKSPRDEEEDHSSSSLDLPPQVPRLHGATASTEGAQSMPFPPSLRPRQDEARRRAKVQMIRAQLQLRARGAIQPSGKLGKLSRLRCGDDPEKPAAASCSGGPVPKLEDALLGRPMQLQDTDCDSPRYETFGFVDFDDELSPLSPLSPVSPGSEKSGSLFWQFGSIGKRGSVLMNGNLGSWSRRVCMVQSARTDPLLADYVHEKEDLRRLHPVLFSNAELWTKDQVQRTVRSIRNDLRHPRWAVADFPAMAHYVDPDLCSLAGGSRYFRCSFPAPGAAPDILRSALLCLEFARDFPEEDPSAVQLF
ncbi:SEC63 [Symbiodinium sp. KB8]|nr:SEC63 [Symbiodinium sp. KB8]